eukprot:CAMPEP_0181333858 /NCGR_PEP_ID=MMETSP1101-20121128/25924_1 /TAXON_ID=46948 /ORGANISM="Rhodomonas abbreviata, Strain Caron Lab Isolate" /LENGTH=73 /DNA_ID=CAMNT_0023443743 /DNA_START=44 /DNA_END=265 /DNA_ORIENTATION=+
MPVVSNSVQWSVRPFRVVLPEVQPGGAHLCSPCFLVLVGQGVPETAPRGQGNLAPRKHALFFFILVLTSELAI